MTTTDRMTVQVHVRTIKTDDGDNMTVAHLMEILSKYPLDSVIKNAGGYVHLDIYNNVPETDKQMKKRISRERAYTKTPKPTKDEGKVFTICVTSRTGLHCSWVFQNKSEANKWVNENKANLEKQYGTMTFEYSTLPGLKIGDQCNVWGEATDVFTIVGISKYSENRYGFHLDNGCREEVAKCHIQHLNMTDSFEDDWLYDNLGD